MQSKDKIIKGICEEMQEEESIPFEYDHFTESDAIPPPFILYRRVAAANFSADGIVYSKGGGIDLEIYAATPDEMANLMDKIEEKLDKAEIFYNKTADTTYISSEDFYETLYEI